MTNKMNELINYKFQLIINKNLYKDNVITIDVYEKVENSLLEKIELLSSELDIVI